MEISINTPRDFSFKRTVISHGWYGLQPFEIDRDNWMLSRVLDLEGTRPVTVQIRALGKGIGIRTSRRLSQAGTKQVVRDVRHMLRLDDDMGDFYSRMAGESEFSWIPTQGAGRMLRSPTVFEDLVKMICTTNCSWALTQKMVTGLVENLGRESNDGRRAFPTPEAMAVMPEKFYVNEVRAGLPCSLL